ncbi:MAG: ABC-F family ATP-binding cassette domain-containing protein [Acidimicrobiales bacterium]|nr:ABC-F family ATP-binding cassette domain-containing protein [Acidimicrobiales bacterium]
MPALHPSPVAATLRAIGISHSLGGHPVLDDVSVSLGPDTRMGVIGPNGAGKSTLLRVLGGLLVPDEGALERSPPTATVGYLAQEHERRPDETVAEHLRRVTGVTDADTELQATADALAAAAPGSSDRYADALERWTGLGASDFEARLVEVTARLGLSDAVLARDVAVLSGGQMARTALAGILLSRHDVLLLDEPTNDLDFAGLELLESFVRDRAQPTMLVSHDRAFLDRTVDHVLELDEHTHRARLYRGGWSAYVAEREADRRHAEEAYGTYAARRRSLSDRAQRERQWATSGAGKEKRRPRDHDTAQRDFRINRTEQLASRARRTERALERLEVVDKPWEGWQLRFEIAEAPRAGSVVARLAGAVVERGSFGLGPLDLEVGWGDRVLLAGPNGSGKTTLVLALLGRLPLVSGECWLGPSVVVGELGQRRERWDPTTPLIDAFLGESGLDRSEGRSLLAKFGLGAAEVPRPVGQLSPGERTRAELACFQARGVNFLVLDEPTNHLDLPAVEQLEAALCGYTGTLLVVSHDRRLLETIDVTRTLDLAPSGERSPVLTERA